MMEQGREWLERSRQSFQAGRYDAALREVAEALRLEPQMADAWNLQGAVLKKLGRSLKALNSYDRALTIDPRFVKAWFNKGLLLEELQWVQEAIACYQTAMELQPDLLKARDRLNVLQHKNVTASRTIQASITSQSSDVIGNGTSEDADSWYERGNQQFEAGDFRGAIASYDKVLEVRPDMHEAWSVRGASLNNLGEYDQALLAAEEAIKINFKGSHAWYVKGFALSGLERDGEAIASFDKALEIEPDMHVAWRSRGLALCHLRCNEEGIASYDKALGIEPDNHIEWNNRGNALSELGRYEEAIVSCDKALDIKPDLSEAWYNRGNALSKLGRYEEAIVSYDKALGFKPDFHRAWIGRGITAGNSLQCTTSVSSSLPLTMQNLVLDQRGYLGKLASYTEGLKYVQKETQSQGRGHLHRSIGVAHYFHNKLYSRLNNNCPNSDLLRKALRSYHTALETLTPETYPEDHLEVIQDLVQAESDLGNTAAAKAHQTNGLQFLQTLLNQSSTFQKRQLELKFSGFRQLTVDVLVNSGELTLALQEADRNKNRALNWILEDWQEPTWSPTYPDIQRLLTHDRAILYWHLSPDTLTTFLLQANTPEPIVSVQPIQPLEDWLKTWNKDYQDYRTKGKENSQHRQTRSWHTNLKSRLTQLQTILQISTLEQQLEGINQLILIPHRQLHQLPLHSLFNKPFTLTYLPSLQVGLNLQQRASGQDPQPTHQAQFLSVENPLNDLQFAEIESVVVQQMFQQTIVLDANEATPQAVQNALENCHGFHFTGHGAYSDRQPQNSALTLANHQPLTTQTIQGLNLQTCQLVCLSACETALTGNQGLDTEYVGLVSAFLQAKAAAVVSTLWTVEEVSNAWLVIYFYSQVILAEQPPVLATRQAQQWLQTVTYCQLVDWLQHQISPLVAALPVAKQIADEIQAIQQDPGKIESQTPPYQNPYFWAAFTFTGLFNNSFTDKQSA